MIYNFLKILYDFAIPFFFRKIYIRNLQNLPVDQPVIIVANHTNAMVDPIMVGLFIKQKIYFLVRSDVFGTPLKRWFLKRFHCLPAYRQQDSPGELYKNEETFRISAELLKQKNTILIFAEGNCIQEMRLRKFKKGTARIAFGAEEANNFNLGVKIIPCGIHYTKPDKFYGDIIVDFGEGFYVNEFREIYEEDKSRALTLFNRKAEDILKKQMVIVENPEMDSTYQRIKEILTNENPELQKNKEVFYSFLKHVSTTLNQCFIRNPEEVEKLKVICNRYFTELKKISIKDRSIKECKDQMLFFSRTLQLVTGGVFFLFGFINNIIPFKLPYLLSKKIVKKVEFFSTVNLFSGVFIFLIWYLMVFFLSSHLLNSWLLGLLYILAAFGSGIYALKYYRMFRRFMGQWRAAKLFGKDKTLMDLIAIRKEIINELKNLSFISKAD